MNLRHGKGTGRSRCMEWKRRREGKSELRAGKKDMRRKRKSGLEDHVKEEHGDQFLSRKCPCVRLWLFPSQRFTLPPKIQNPNGLMKGHQLPVRESTCNKHMLGLPASGNHRGPSYACLFVCLLVFPHKSRHRYISLLMCQT